MRDADPTMMIRSHSVKLIDLSQMLLLTLQNTFLFFGYKQLYVTATIFVTVDFCGLFSAV